MSMASYNLLKAAADGLADAINYRTNLKRKRREEEYNYQRDLQRAREEHVYDRALALKENEEDYKIKRGRTKQEHQEKVQGMHDFLNNKYYGKELITPQQIQDFNFEAIADDQPFSVALPKKDTFAQQIALEDYKQKNRIALQQTKNAAKGGSGQPRPNSRIEYDKWRLSLPDAENERLERLHGSSKAVKGGNGAVKERDPFTLGNTYMDKIYRILDEARNVLPSDKVNAITKRIEIENQPEEKMSKEQKAKLLAAMDNETKLLDASAQALLKEYEQRVRDVWMQGDNHVRWATDGKYGLHAVSYRTIKPDEVSIADEQAANDFITKGQQENDDLINKTKRVPGVGQNVYPQPASSSIDLYHETPPSNVAKAPLDSSNREIIPPSVKPFGDVPASATQQLNQNIIDLVQNYRNSIEIQRKAGVMGPKMYRQTVSMLDDMMTAYARGEITADVIERTLRPSVYKKNLMTGARQYDY